jgi:histone acetyltransferase (RNA polymerase elongator complex component)
MMVGLPGDSDARALTTARKIADLDPDFVRIYPTVVVENSCLAQWFKKGKYLPLSLEDAVTLVKKIYLLFKQEGIEVIRMGLQASDDLEDGSTVLAGPYHPAFGHLVYSEVFWDKALAAIESAGFVKDTLTIFEPAVVPIHHIFDSKTRTRAPHEEVWQNEESKAIG